MAAPRSQPPPEPQPQVGVSVTVISLPARKTNFRAGFLNLVRLFALDHSTRRRADVPRSEEHTSELQSRPHLVCRLLLEKKKKKKKRKDKQKKKKKIKNKKQKNK